MWNINTLEKLIHEAMRHSPICTLINYVRIGHSVISKTIVLKGLHFVDRPPPLPTTN